ncbi:CHAT domain-containing protein [Flavobacterium sp.]
MRIVLFFLITQLTFSQGKTSALENRIYSAIDVFVANPTEQNLKKLEIQQATFEPKSKAEMLAMVILNCNKAYYENQFGQTKKAISSYEKAWLQYQKNKLSNYDITEFCLKPLGNLYTIVGDYDNAENTIKHYFYIANVEKNQEQKFAAILNLSNVFQNTGKINEAINLLEKTIQTEKLTSIQKGILYNNLGNNYFLTAVNFSVNDNPYSKGEAAYKKAIALLKSKKNQSESLSNAYRNLAKRYMVTQEFGLAKINMDYAKSEFLKLAKQEPRKKARFYLDEATILLQQDSLLQCEKRLKDIFTVLIPSYNSKNNLPEATLLYAETTLLDALDLYAEVYLKQNQAQKALHSYQLSAHIEDLFQSLMMTENSKIISQIRSRNRTEKSISIYYNLYQKEKKTTYSEGAYILQEETKSTVLKEYISNSKTISGDEKLIREQLQNWNTIIVNEQQKLEAADISKINEAIKKQNELMLLLKSKKSEESKSTKKDFNLTKLYSKLEKDNAIMVSYFFGVKNIFIFTLNDKKIDFKAVNNSDTAKPKIVQFIDYFNNSETISNNPLEFNQYSNVAYKILNLPEQSKHKNLIVIPDGILTLLPFEALITKPSNTKSFAKMHYLLNDFKVGYANSASFYLDRNPFKHTTENILGVFPIFENSALELAFSIKELEYLKNNFTGNYLEKSNATFQNFKKNAGNYSILHLSTHASSGDIIEPANIRFYDQEILYSQLYTLSINPDLVVLSACETGIGKLYRSEGAMSVARGFQFAGAQNLLFSLWKVNDFTTSVLMEKFYSEVKNGNSYFEANHQAKLDFLADESISNAKKSPYYWSAFVYYGTLENKSSDNNFSWVTLILGIIILILIYKFVQFKKRKKLPIEKANLK